MRQHDAWSSLDLRVQREALGAIPKARRVAVHDERHARRAQLLRNRVHGLVLHARHDCVISSGHGALQDVEDRGGLARARRTLDALDLVAQLLDDCALQLVAWYQLGERHAAHVIVRELATRFRRSEHGEQARAIWVCLELGLQLLDRRELSKVRLGVPDDMEELGAPCVEPVVDAPASLEHQRFRAVLLALWKQEVQLVPPDHQAPAQITQVNRLGVHIVLESSCHDRAATVLTGYLIFKVSPVEIGLYRLRFGTEKDLLHLVTPCTVGILDLGLEQTPELCHYVPAAFPEVGCRRFSLPHAHTHASLRIHDHRV